MRGELQKTIARLFEEKEELVEVRLMRLASLGRWCTV